MDEPKDDNQPEESNRPQFTLQTLAAAFFFIATVLTVLRDAGTIQRNSVDVGMLQSDVKALEFKLSAMTDEVSRIKKAVAIDSLPSNATNE